MQSPESTLLVLTLILFLGLILPEIFKRIKLPAITALILFGAFLGPNGFGFIQPDKTIEFFGFLGFTFLMFLAGLETNPETVKKSFKKISFIAVLNSLIPFFVGLFITRYFGYSLTASLFVGMISSASSVALTIQILPTLKDIKKKDQYFIDSIMVVEDIMSLLGLAILFQMVSPETNMPLPLFLFLLIAGVGILWKALPKFANYLISKNYLNNRKVEYEGEVRFIIVMLTVVLLLFSTLGVHPILAAFLVGMLLSNVITSEIIHTKFHTLGYGLFVPVFFFITGMEIDLKLLKNIDADNLVLPVLILGAFLSKWISGYLAAKISDLKNPLPRIISIASMSKLTTTLAATYSAAAIGILDETLTTTMVLLSVISTILVPVLLKIGCKKC